MKPKRGTYLCRKTGKIRWLSERDAGVALARARSNAKRPDGQKLELRQYQCGYCYKWHLTSQPKNA